MFQVLSALAYRYSIKHHSHHLNQLSGALTPVVIIVLKVHYNTTYRIDDVRNRH